MNLFLQSFSKYISPDDTIILAVSGGVDSMVLFDMVKKYHPKEKIVVSHFDHMLRGIESDGDRDLVASICKSENMVFELKKMDISTMAKEEKNSLEAIARRERYRFFETVRQRYQGKYILTAHHADDQVETILMSLMKGGRIRGLSGMSIISNMRFRPLLGIKKSELLEYARKNNVCFREDSTNTDEAFLRNKIRHTLVPIFQNIEPSINDMLCGLGEYMQEVSLYLEKEVQNWLIRSELLSKNLGSFISSDFLDQTIFFQREIIAYLYTRAHGGSTQGLSQGNIEECLRFIREASNSHGIKEIKKLRLVRKGGQVYYFLN